MIPLIDTMFLLLAFFVVAILAMEFLQGIPVDLAAASTATTPESNGIFVTITKDEAVLVDGDLVKPAALVQRIRARGESGDAGPVLISADAGVRFESVLDLLDRLREARVEQVFLQTRSESP
jgi:biopolymer transport protein ExbD